MKHRLDPDSPVPLYHQIAEALRWSLSTGRLQRGDRLPAVRAAAEQYGVHRHTVRRAYRELAEEGLVEVRGAGGTVVLGGISTGRNEETVQATPGDLEHFLADVLQQAETRFGLGPEALVEHLGSRARAGAGAPEIVYAVECSESQSRDMAREISARWRVDARPWCLRREGEPPPGPIVATYFHYPEIQRRWPHRRPEVQFVPIHPDPDLPRRVAPALDDGGAPRLAACELDEAKALNLKADLSVLFPPPAFEIETRTVSTAGAALADRDDRTPVLFSPRAWAALSDEDREDPRALKTLYRIEPDALEALGRDLSWPSAPAGSPVHP